MQVPRRLRNAERVVSVCLQARSTVRVAAASHSLSRPSLHSQSPGTTISRWCGHIFGFTISS